MNCEKCANMVTCTEDYKELFQFCNAYNKKCSEIEICEKEVILNKENKQILFEIQTATAQGIKNDKGEIIGWKTCWKNNLEGIHMDFLDGKIEGHSSSCYCIDHKCKYYDIDTKKCFLGIEALRLKKEYPNLEVR